MRRYLRYAIIFKLLSWGAFYVSPALAWRSSLYPEHWAPPDTNQSFYADAFIQDYSYAGYRRGESSIPNVTNPVFDVTSYGADTNGMANSTAGIQAAIDAASTAGGGVVYMPAGTYKVGPIGANNYALRIPSDNIVLRGDGVDQTYLLNTNYVMRSKKIIVVSPSVSGGGWVAITADLNGPVRRIPVADTSGFSVGDMVRMDWTFTAEWINEHNQGTWWSATNRPANAEYLREVTAVDTNASWIEIDIPTRYSMNVRDGARVQRYTGMVSGVGIENFSIGNVQHPGTGFAEGDYAVPGTVGYDAHGSYLIDIRNALDSWIRGVSTYRPAGNTSTCHLLSNGILLADSTRITVQNCHLQRPQYGGGGGNGYMYRIGIAHENLLKDCIAEFSRHGFVISSPGTSGNVFWGCEDRETGRATGTGAGYTTSGSGSDHHMHFSHSNMYDSNHANNSFWTAHHRLTSGTIPHGLTSAHSTYWNTSGSGTRYSTIVESEQGRYGYIIGTSGSKSGASNPTGGNTSPADIVEGVGAGNTLEPQSLYQDQLAKRMQGILVDAGRDVTLFTTNSVVPLNGSIYTYGSQPLTSVWSQVSGPSAAFSDTNTLDTTVACDITGDYVFKLAAWDASHTNQDEIVVTVLDGEIGALASMDSIVGQAQALAPEPGYYVDAANAMSGATGSSFATNRENRVLVLGFTLPELPPGQSLASAALNFEITKARDQAGIDPALDVYLLDTADPSGSGTGYFYNGSSDASIDTKPVGSVYVDVGIADVTFADDEKDQVFLLEGDALALLQSFYGGDHIPDQSEAFFRFNLDKTWDYAGGTPYQRYFIDLAADESALIVAGTGDVYAVSYDGNGHTGGAIPVDSNVYEEGILVTVLGNTNALVKSGYGFDGWNTQTNGSGSRYEAGNTFSMPARSVILYAQWTATTTYGLVVSNGIGGGAYPAGTDVPIMANIPQTGYRFSSWASIGGGTIADTNASTTVFTMPANAVTVTAQYAANLLPVVDAGSDQTVLMSGLIPWTPSEITTVLWLDAADTNTISASGGTVSEWRDKSGNTNHASQVTPGLQPTTGTINGHNALASQATVGEYMDLASTIVLSDHSIFGVLQAASDPVDLLTSMGMLAKTDNSWDSFTMTFTDPSGGNIRCRSEDDGGVRLEQVYVGCTTLTTPFLFGEVRVKGTSNALYYNGTNAASAGGTLTNDLSIGVLFRGYAGAIGSNGQPWDGKVGEIIIANSALPDSDRQKIEGYLAHKWGLTNSLPAAHPYKSMQPGTPTATVSLDGVVSDPEDDPVSVSWSMTSGPAAVTFTNVATVDTAATFTEMGVYTLRLSADDGFGTNYDECVITVGESTRPQAYQDWLISYYADAGIDDTQLSSNRINTIREAYVAGIDPLDASARFEIDSMHIPAEGRILQWSGVTGRLYHIYWSTNISAGFELWESNLTWTTGTFTDTVHTAVDRGFYRIAVELEE